MKHAGVSMVIPGLGNNAAGYSRIGQGEGETTPMVGVAPPPPARDEEAAAEAAVTPGGDAGGGGGACKLPGPCEKPGALPGGIREPSLDKHSMGVGRLFASPKDYSGDPTMRRFFYLNAVLFLLYLASGIAVLFVALFFTKQHINFFWSPLRWNSGGHLWQVFLEHAHGMFVDLFLAAMCFAFAVFRGLHLLSGVRVMYENMVMNWSYNTFRWVGHALIMGGLFGAAAIFLGVRDVVLFSALWVVYALYCGCMLMMEECNECSAGRRGSKMVVNWLPFIGAALAIAFVMAVFLAYFIVEALDAFSHVPWYVFVLLIWVGVFTLIEVGIHVLYHATSWLRGYVMVELVSVIVEAFLVMGITWAIMFGLIF